MVLGKLAVTVLVLRSTRETVLSPQLGTQRLPNPMARPEQGLLPTVTVSATLLVPGSSLETLFLGLLEIQTASPMTCQSGEPPSSKMTSGLSKPTRIFTPAALT